MCNFIAGNSYFEMCIRDRASYKPGKDVYIALDPAATEFFKDGEYNLKGEGKVLTPSEMVGYYKSLVEQYPVISIEAVSYTHLSCGRFR